MTETKRTNFISFRNRVSELLDAATGNIGSRWCRVHETSFRVPRIGKMMASPSEPWMLDLLKSALPMAKGAFVDVGANLGQTLLVVKALDPGCEYLGFEPNPACSFYLDRLINLSGLEHVSILPVALADKTRPVRMDRYSDNPGDSSASIVPSFRHRSKIKSSLFVPAYRYEDLGSSVTELSTGIVKIDVEGAELEVLSSLEGAIKRDRPMLVMEVLPVYSKNNHERLKRQSSIERLLNDWSYSLFRLVKDEDGHLSGLLRVESFGIHENIDHCDYLVVGTERAAEIVNRFPVANGDTA